MGRGGGIPPFLQKNVSLREGASFRHFHPKTVSSKTVSSMESTINLCENRWQGWGAEGWEGAKFALFPVVFHFFAHTKSEQKLNHLSKLLPTVPANPSVGMQRRRESHQRAGERSNDRRRQSCETTVVCTPEQRNGTERVERRGPSLRPNFPQTGETTKRHLSPRRSSGYVVPCPPELWCTRLRRPWPPLAVPSRPQLSSEEQ